VTERFTNPVVQSDQAGDNMDFSSGHDNVLRWFRQQTPQIDGQGVVLRWLRGANKKVPIMLGVNKNIRFDGCWGCGRGA
jgi:hypothetical protein